MSESQSYQYNPNPEGQTWIFTLRKNGMWMEAGKRKDGLSVSIGVRRKYYDYSF
jgi:hypothetical protein